MLFGSKTQQPLRPRPQNKKQKNIKPSSLDMYLGHTKTMSQGNKKITTRKILATNNKVLVHTGSLHFPRNKIIKFKL